MVMVSPGVLYLYNVQSLIIDNREPLSLSEFSDSMNLGISLQSRLPEHHCGQPKDLAPHRRCSSTP